MAETETVYSTIPPAEPPVNIYESGGELSVALPIPGTHAQNVEVVVRPDRLRVDAACKYPQSSQSYLRRDWQVGEWLVDVRLPRRIQPGRSRATLHHGVLVVMAPIAEDGADDQEARPAVEG